MQMYKRGAAVIGALTVLAAAIFTTVKIGSSGTTIDGHYRTTATINVNAIPASGATSSNVTLTGTVVGDHCNVAVTSGDFLSTTSTGWVNCYISSTSTATLIFRNTMPTSTFDAGSSVFSVNAFSY